MKFSSTALLPCVFLFAVACAPGQIDSDGGDESDAGGEGGVQPVAAGGQTGQSKRDGGAFTNLGGSRGASEGGASGSEEDADATAGDDASVSAPDAGARPDAGGGPALPRVAITAAGYAGRRITSFDNGTTWVGDQRLGGGGDDEFLLRDVAFGAGRVVAVGWKILSSTNGTQWTEHRNPHGQWQGGVAWGNNMFLAAGGLGRVARSTDGITWQSGANAGNSHIRRVVFSDGYFWATGDSGTVYRTQDGRAWTTGGSFPSLTDNDGSVRVRIAGDGVQITTDGASWKTVLKTSGLEGVSIGRLP